MAVRNVLKQSKESVYGNIQARPEELDLAGWVAPAFETVFREMAAKLPEEPLVIEIGTWLGRSTNLMADILKTMKKNAEIVAVDTFLGAPEMWTWGLEQPERGVALNRVNGYPTLYEKFLKNVKLQGNTDTITPFPLSSMQAAEVLSYYKVQADLIYIDGSHEENAVYGDLNSFWPLLREKGTLLGDDFNWPGVKSAVEKFATENNLTVVVDRQGIVWHVTK